MLLSHSGNVRGPQEQQQGRISPVFQRARLPRIYSLITLSTQNTKKKKHQGGRLANTQAISDSQVNQGLP